MKPEWIKWLLGIVVAAFIGLAAAGATKVSDLEVRIASHAEAQRFIMRDLEEIKKQLRRIEDKIDNQR